MARQWLGPARFLFLPVEVQGSTAWSAPPAGFRDLVERRVFFDPDPLTGVDRSLSAYLFAASGGRATLDATVSDPVVVTNIGSQSPTTLAINAHPDSHLYAYSAVVMPTNQDNVGGMAAAGPTTFTPGRSENLSQGRCRFLWDERIGAWAMEVMHAATWDGGAWIDDYYWSLHSMKRFDQMADAVATHPTVYTKVRAGWMDPAEVHTVAPAQAANTYLLHANGLPRPAPAGRVSALRIQAPGSERYLMVEARLPVDQWERGVAGGGKEGLSSHGVIAYEYAPNWPSYPPNRPRPPIELRTVTALVPGQAFSHTDNSVSGSNERDYRTHVGRSRKISVEGAIHGGFAVRVEVD